jgi:hypothetical protein
MYLRLFNDLEDKFKKLHVSVVDCNRMGSSSVVPMNGLEVLEFISSHTKQNSERTYHYINDVLFVVDDFTFVANYAQTVPEVHRDFFILKINRFYFSYMQTGLTLLNEVDEISTHLPWERAFKQLQTALNKGIKERARLEQKQ